MALINKKLTELDEKLSVSDDAWIHVVEPLDLTQSPQGSSYKAKKSTISGTVKSQSTVSGTVKTNSNSADPIVYLKSEVDALIVGKENALGFTPENIANKQNNLSVDITNTKYPTVSAVNLGLSDKATTADLLLKADKTSTYTKAEVDNLDAQVLIDANVYTDSKVTSLYKIMPSVANFASLPLIDNEVGDVRNVIDTGMNYVWDGVLWDALGSTVDISGKEDVANKQNSLAVDATNLKYPTVTAVNTGLALKANIASPTFTGTPTAPTATAGTNTTQIATTAFVQGGLATKENTFSKNTAFNKNFGTTASTVAEGNDSRILNGQTAFGWGNHSGLYPTYNGTGATGTWGISVSGNATSATNWGGNTANFSIEAGVIDFAAVFDGGVAKYAGVTKFKSWLGLGSNAYSSTAYLPLTGGTLTGNLNGTTADFSTHLMTDKILSNALAISIGNAQVINAVPGNLYIGNPGLNQLFLEFGGTSASFTASGISFPSTVTATNFNGSATLTGTPTAPTATTGTNTTQIATTAFVQGIKPYKVYTAIVTLNTSDVVSTTVFENTTGITPSIVFTGTTLDVTFAGLNQDKMWSSSLINRAPNDGSRRTITGVTISNGYSYVVHNTSGVATSGSATGQIKYNIEIRVYN